MIQIEIGIGIGIENDVVIIEALNVDFDPDFDSDFDSNAKNQPVNFSAVDFMCYLRLPSGLFIIGLDFDRTNR
jgi:hypothetical protein